MSTTPLGTYLRQGQSIAEDIRRKVEDAERSLQRAKLDLITEARNEERATENLDRLHEQLDDIRELMSVRHAHEQNRPDRMTTEV